LSEALEQRAANGWLRAHETNPEEILELLLIARRDLKDANCLEVSADTRFSCAYNGVLKLATVLLYASGYEPERDQSHHFRVIESIPAILGPTAKLDSEYLNQCRKHRNASEYSLANVAKDAQAEELVAFASRFLEKVETWMQAKGIIPA
jgi:uncharacterized protein (UPF0332 family)